MCLTKCPSSSTGSYMIIPSVRGPLDNSQIGPSQQTGPRLHKVVTFVGSAAAMQHYVVLSAPLLPPLSFSLSLFLFFLCVSHPYLPTITQKLLLYFPCSRADRCRNDSERSPRPEPVVVFHVNGSYMCVSERCRACRDKPGSIVRTSYKPLVWEHMHFFFLLLLPFGHIFHAVCHVKSMDFHLIDVTFFFMWES